MQSNLNEEALILLKSQVSKLKLMSNELELRDKQMDMLKETIRSLQQQRDQISAENDQLRLELSTMTEEMQKKLNKFELAFSGVENERRLLQQENTQLKQTLSDNTRQLKSSTKLQRDLERNNDDLHRQMKTLREQVRQYSQNSSAHHGQMQTLKKQLKISKQSLNEQLSEMTSIKQQFLFSQQQTQLYKSKYEEVLMVAEQHQKQLQQEKGKVKGLQQVQKTFDNMKEDLNRLKIQHQKAVFSASTKEREILILRESLIKLKEDHEKSATNLSIDFGNLFTAMQGCSAEQQSSYRKVSHFYSINAEQFQKIQNCFQFLHQSAKTLNAEKQQLQYDLNRAKSDLGQKQQLLIDLAHELDVLKINCQNEIKGVAVEYERKLQQLSIRLKQEEMELIRLKNSDRQLSQLNEELEVLKEKARGDQQKYREQIKTLQQQNQILQRQVRDLIPLCQESITVKSKSNQLKMLICELIRCLLFAVSKSKQVGLLLGLLKNFYGYYEKIHGSLRNLTKSKIRGINRFRAIVIGLQAVKRLTKITKNHQQFYGKQENESPLIIMTGKDRQLRKLIRQCQASDDCQITDSDMDLVSRLTESEEPSFSILLHAFSQRMTWPSNKVKPFNPSRVALQDTKLIQSLKAP